MGKTRDRGVGAKFKNLSDSRFLQSAWSEAGRPRPPMIQPGKRMMVKCCFRTAVRPLQAIGPKLKPTGVRWEWGESPVLMEGNLYSDMGDVEKIDEQTQKSSQEGPTMVHAANDSRLVVIDEIKRIPELLNEVHRLIEKRKIRFLLTGSSARKLRRGQANLLAGRVWEAGCSP
jgi:hypothetical protein